MKEKFKVSKLHKRQILEKYYLHTQNVIVMPANKHREVTLS